MAGPTRFARIATMAVLPFAALVIFGGLRAISSAPAAVPVPRTGLLVVADLRGEALVVYDLEAASPARTLSLPGPPHEMVEAAGRLYITLGRANLLVEVDPRAPAILRMLPLEGEPHGLAVDGDRLFVTLDRAAAMVTVDRRSLAVAGRTETGDTPHAVIVAGGVAYVTDSRDNRVRRVASPAQVAPTGALPEGIAVAGDLLATADAGSRSLSVYRLPGLVPHARVEVPGSPSRVVAATAGTIAVALNDRSTVAIVDPARARVERTVPVGGRPDGLCLDPSSAYLAVASNEAGTVQFIRLSDHARSPALAAGEGPGACAWLR
jgi:DNA-binding beta-propeller fold protein YncE